MLGVDVNLSLVSDGTSSIRNEARKPQHEPNRSHHGIDLKNPFTMSNIKRALALVSAYAELFLFNH